MLTIAAQLVVQVAFWPLAVLLMLRAFRRRQTVASAVSAVYLATWATAVLFDPGGASWVSSVANVVLHISIAFLLAVFPDGKPTPRWTIVPVIAVVALQAGNLLTGFGWETRWWWPFALLLGWLILLLGGQLFRFMRRSGVDERRQASWPLLGILVQMIAFSVLASIQLGITGELTGDASAAAAIMLNSLSGIGLAIGLLAPRLFRVDKALRSVIAVGGAAVGLVAVFSFVVTVLPALGGSPDVVLWASGVCVAILGYPFGRLAIRLADWVVYRGRPDPLLVLDRLGTRLDGAIDPLVVPQTIVSAIGEALSLSGARLRGAGIGTASWGDPVDPLVEFPVVYQTIELAVLEVSPRAGETDLNEHDRTVIVHLLRQAAAALSAARAISDLVDARARIVLAHEEERRRLRRDLHDDLAPTFAGLGMNAAVVREYSRVGDERATEAAGQLADSLAAASRQIREIAYGLRPPVLDDLGLSAAIRSRVISVGSVPDIELISPAGRPDLPAAVETAALRIVQEAVANVRRHADADRCRVELVVEPSSLLVTIEDDGRGLPDDVVDGIGLRSIRERTGELGGTVSFRRRQGGGTQVRVRLPLGVAVEP